MRAEKKLCTRCGKKCDPLDRKQEGESSANKCVPGQKRRPGGSYKAGAVRNKEAEKGRKKGAYHLQPLVIVTLHNTSDLDCSHSAESAGRMMFDMQLQPVNVRVDEAVNISRETKKVVEDVMEDVKTLHRHSDCEDHVCV